MRLKYIARIPYRLKRTKMLPRLLTQVRELRLLTNDNSSLEFRFYDCDVLTGTMLPTYLLPN